MRIDNVIKGSWSRVKKVHFVGICGSGMCGIAEILYRLGYQVSGSDPLASSAGENLHKLGIKVFDEHKADNLRDIDLVVYSAAVPEDNPELSIAREKEIPLVGRAEMLAEIMRFGFGIAVSGAHGKTTTTSMLVDLLVACGEDLTFVVGGLVKSAGSNARLGSGKYVVAEADESDASFLHLHPDVSIVTNIDREHLVGYQGNFHKVKRTFLEFLHNLPFYGLAVLCTDDEYLPQLLDQVARPYVTYGFNKDAHYRAEQLKHHHQNTEFQAVFPDGEKARIHLQVPGRHNVLNALACLATASELKMDRRKAIKGLGDFKGVARRQDLLGVFGNGEISNIMLIDDYGHHPREIEATLNAFRSGWPRRRAVMIFQPHRYTRTQDLYDEFVRVLSQVDLLFLLDVYAAGEQPIEGADSRHLSMSIRRFGKVDPVHIRGHQEIPDLLSQFLRTDDMLIVQGAGSIGNIAKDLAHNRLYLKA